MEENKNNKKLYLYVYILIHFAIILIVCINDSYSSIRKYHSLHKVVRNNAAQTAMSSLLNLPVIREYKIFAGVDIGYGFFSLNVATPYVLQCVQMDKNGVPIKENYYPNYTTREGLIMFASVMSYFRLKLKFVKYRNRTVPYKFFLKKLITDIGKNVINSNLDSNCTAAQINLCLYSYPTLKSEAVVASQKQKLIKTDSIWITKDTLSGKFNFPAMTMFSDTNKFQ